MLNDLISDLKDQNNRLTNVYNQCKDENQNLIAQNNEQALRIRRLEDEIKCFNIRKENQKLLTCFDQDHNIQISKQQKALDQKDKDYKVLDEKYKLMKEQNRIYQETNQNLKEQLQKWQLVSDQVMGFDPNKQEMRGGMDYQPEYEEVYDGGYGA